MATALAPARRKKRRLRPSNNGRRPTWELLRYLPHQGEWTEDEYLALEARFGDNIRVEMSDGNLEVLPVPTQAHQLLILYFVRCLDAFAQAHAPGVVLFSGIRVKLRIGSKTKFREPDVVYMSTRHASRRHEEFWEGADLVMEIVSGDHKDRLRDWKVKPRDYAAAGIPEYWVIDPDKKLIRVYSLRGKSYRRHGDFKPGDQASSVLLPGFAVSVSDVFAAGAV